MGPVTHITPVILSRGGMQSHIRRHRDLDRAAGRESRVVSLFETMPRGQEDIGLGAAWWWTPARLRRNFLRRGVRFAEESMAVYHNAWGLPLLAPGDGAARRVACLHTDWPGLAPAVQASVRWCDAIICVSGSLAESVRRLAPGYPAERVYRIKYPVEPPAFAAAAPAEAAEAARPFRIGYVGRLESAQKRVERLPALMRAWSAAGGGAAEWHVLGDGPERGRLEPAMRAEGDVRFHGWLEGAAYWRVLAALDAIVFLSDYEGTPIALLEAMSAGVPPVYPGIGGDGEELARALGPDGVYPAGDVAAAAGRLAALAAGDRAGRRIRVRAIVAGYTPEQFAADLARLIADAWARPRYSASDVTRPGRWSDRLPMAVVRRYHERAIWR